MGKTLLTALLLADLRADGIKALAMKPFCSGSWNDAKLLNNLQNRALSRAQITPFYFPEPVAPLLAARNRDEKVTLLAVLESINKIKKRCDALLIEGAGGLLVPLGEDFSVKDLITKLDCRVVVVARNRLGVINHVRLTVENMQLTGIKDITVVLMGCKPGDISAHSNAEIIWELIWPVPVFEVPFLGNNGDQTGAVKKSAKKIKKTIALIRESANFISF